MREIEIIVNDKDMHADDLIGYCAIKAEDIMSGPVSGEFELLDAKGKGGRGFIEVEIIFESAQDSVKVGWRVRRRHQE